MEYILAIITLILIFIIGFVAIWYFTGHCAKHSKFYGEEEKKGVDKPQLL